MTDNPSRYRESCWQRKRAKNDRSSAFCDYTTRQFEEYLERHVPEIAREWAARVDETEE